MQAALTFELNGRAGKGAPLLARSHGEGRITALCVSAIGNAGEHEDRSRRGRKKATPFPTHIISPVPSSPIVILIPACGNQIASNVTNHPFSAELHTRHGIPRNPSTAERERL